MSTLPLKAGIGRARWHVRFVPEENLQSTAPPAVSGYTGSPVVASSPVYDYAPGYTTKKQKVSAANGARQSFPRSKSGAS